MFKQEYFRGRGKLFVAPIVDNVVGSFRWFGNVPAFGPTFNTTTIQHKESYSGIDAVDLRLPTENVMNISAELEVFNRENIALATRSKLKVLASGVGFLSTSPLVLKVDDIWVLPHQSVKNVVVNDSAVTPVVVDSTDYVLDLVFGTVTVVDPVGYTLPWKITYDTDEVEIMAIFSQPLQEVALRFQGINIAMANRPIAAEIYRVALDPTKEFGLITSGDLGKIQLEGTALVDPSKPADDIWGQFGRLIYPKLLP